MNDWFIIVNFKLEMVRLIKVLDYLLVFIFDLLFELIWVKEFNKDNNFIL